jgi:dihydrodipicolinate synthase/N-acetylneuraminate lyase
MSSPFTGLGVALITPFRANGAIDHVPHWPR